MSSMNNGNRHVPARCGTSIRHGKEKAIMLFIGLAAVIVAISLVFVLRGRTEAPVLSDLPEQLPASATLEIDADSEEGGLVYRSKEEIQEELNQKVQEGMINISMNTSPVFASGTAKGNLMIVNSPTNNYPQIVYIIRKDTGEEIYRSKGIPVGSKIEYAALNVDLAPGTYDCVAYFNNADPQTGEILGTAGAEIVITVGE